MPLLNYTTKVPVGRTINQMQDKLALAGAKAIALEYDDFGQVSGFQFAIDTPYGRQGFSLPCEWQRTQAVLTRQRQRDDDDHARRVAWRILKDWLEAQLALIETEMVTLDQVMLPYMRTQSGETMYELVKDQQLQLEPG